MMARSRIERNGKDPCKPNDMDTKSPSQTVHCSQCPSHSTLSFCRMTTCFMTNRSALAAAPSRLGW